MCVVCCNAWHSVRSMRTECHWKSMFCPRLLTYSVEMDHFVFLLLLTSSPIPHSCTHPLLGSIFCLVWNTLCLIQITNVVSSITSLKAYSLFSPDPQMTLFSFYHCRRLDLYIDDSTFCLPSREWIISLHFVIPSSTSKNSSFVNFPHFPHLWEGARMLSWLCRLTQFTSNWSQ